MATKHYSLNNTWEKITVGDGVVQVISGKIFISSNTSDSLSTKNALVISQFLNTSAGSLWMRTAANNGESSEIVVDDGVNDAGEE